MTLDRTNFKKGSAELTEESIEQLKNISVLMNTFYYSQIKFGGYTDNTGSEQHNLELSQARAESVIKELIKLGVDEERVHAEGFGSKHPICPENNSEVCRAQNRRVDLLLLQK